MLTEFDLKLECKSYIEHFNSLFFFSCILNRIKEEEEEKTESEIFIFRKVVFFFIITSLLHRFSKISTRGFLNKLLYQDLRK